MDDATRGGPARSCPWCSTELAADAASCPSCGATLTPADADPQIPGVTTVSPSAAAASAVKAPKPNRLMRWISGEPSEDVTLPPPPPGSLEPPPAEVRREIRRLELEAELTNLSAEASAIATEDALEARAANDVAGAEAALQVAHDARAVAEAIDRADAAAFAEPGPPADGPGADAAADTVADPSANDESPSAGTADAASVETERPHDEPLSGAPDDGVEAAPEAAEPA